jgi:hypothetical protein
MKTLKTTGGYINVQQEKDGNCYRDDYHVAYAGCYPIAHSHGEGDYGHGGA